MHKERLKVLVSLKLVEILNDFNSFLNEMIDYGYLEESQIQDMTNPQMFTDLFDRCARVRELEKEEHKKHNPY